MKSLSASVLIPVFNNKKGLYRCLNSVFKQSIDSSHYEVIVIDNGSDENLESVVEDFPEVILLEECEYLGSPYSARNRGFEVATGNVLVMLDTTCAPSYDWLCEGLNLIESGADLVGGNVVFDINEKSTLGELYDSITNIRMKESVLNRNVAKTTNLFVKRAVVDSIGGFKEGLRSGGDVSWTKKATSQDFKLLFGEKASASMTPRKLLPLIHKQFRVSKGQVSIWMEHGGFLRSFIFKCLLSFLPPNPFNLKKLAIESGNKIAKGKIPSLFFVGYLLRLVSGVGILAGLILNLREIGKCNAR